MSTLESVRDSAVHVSKVGYIEIESPDLDRLADYYTRILDFQVVDASPDTVYLTTTFDHHSVVLRRGELRPRTAVGYEIREDIADAEKRLRAAGYSVSRRSDIAPSTPDVLVIDEPTTGSSLHLFDGQSGSGVPKTVLQPTKLGHIAAWVEDLPSIQSFYQDLLGFRWSDTVGDFFVFLRCNSDHHAANFMVSNTQRGMNHVAFETRDFAHLQTLLDHLAAQGVRLDWGVGRHGPGHNLFSYHRDPDGNVVELFTQLDTVIDEATGYFEPRPWHQDAPQRPKTWEVDVAAMNSWGPLNPQMLDR